MTSTNVSIDDNNGSADSLRESLLPPEQQNEVDDSESSLNKDVVFPRWTVCRDRNAPPPRLNHNVALNLLLCVLYGISDSLWGGTVIAAYLKNLGRGSNSLVGNVEAANGLAGLLSALPVGYLADKVGRAKVIRWGGILLLITAVLHMSLLEWIGVDESAQHPNAFWLLGAIMSLWGIAGGVVNGPAQALYADSTPAGNRSKYYTWLFATYVLASCVGPLVSIVLFQTLGDDWDLYHLRIVLYVGLGIELVNAVIMMFFDDRKALDESGEDIGESRPSNGQEADVERAPSSSETTGPEENQESTRLAERRKYIPYITFCQALIFSIGSGMTVKFFPLFFKDEVGMSPTQVQIIYVLVPVVMTLFSGVGQKLASTGFGRVQSAIVFNSAGVFCLYSMVIFKSFLDARPFALVPIYVIRTSLMNCTYPLQESILMDFVPKNERARWKSLDSIAVFGWCGSAAFGGWLTDKYDYTHTFCITALLQTLGIFMFALLLPLVPRKEQDLATTNGSESSQPTTTTAPTVEKPTQDGIDGNLDISQTATAASSSASLAEPLLNSS